MKPLQTSCTLSDSMNIHRFFIKSGTIPLLLVSGFHPRAQAHDAGFPETQSHGQISLDAPDAFIVPAWFLAQTGAPTQKTPPPKRPTPMETLPQKTESELQKPKTAAFFERFSPKVAIRWDNQFLYVESNGIPSHNMMVGITNWQQQVPLPQKYTDGNAWRIPLHPRPAAEPVSIKGRFLRGAVALAVNGIPIFNPQNNRGEISADIGELDQWGGHCGRADDYHYHAAPLHLQSSAGLGNPIAYALDGYPIFGLTEPSGKQPTELDSFSGHESSEWGYHYHASSKYPYVNGGFHGVVVEKDGQVDPQPRAQPVREALKGLRGAKIISFEATAINTYKLGYELNAEKRAVLYATNTDGSVTFEFQNGRDGTTRETYTPKPGNGGARENNPPPPGSQARQREQDERPKTPPRPPKQNNSSAPAPAANWMAALPRSAEFILRSSEVQNGGELPTEFTGDGAGSTLPLQWTGAPAGTKSYALVMHHLDPEGKTKWYWILYNIPPSVQSLAKNSRNIGILGNSFRGQIGYEPPHSKGPGAKTYVLTLFAISRPLEITIPAAKVDFETVMTAMKGSILAATDLSVIHTRAGNSAEGPPPPRPRPQSEPKPGPPPVPAPPLPPNVVR